MFVQRLAFTGAPGSGKMQLLRGLADRGFPVVEEAATGVIASEQRAGIDAPWLSPSFIDDVIALQLRRLAEPSQSSKPQLHDRSLICTLALARYLGHAPSSQLLAAIEAARVESTYDSRVFFVRPLGFVSPTSARRISYEGSLIFERVHSRTLCCYI